MKTIFDYDKSKNKPFDLYLYIKSNLYDKEISINRGGKVSTFEWNYIPQSSGGYKQNEAYQRVCIDKMVEMIIKTKNQ
tara:strand:+ start:446 stop:679 length:234 start_codon:yes stop_codon:yes gene_type:complete